METSGADTREPSGAETSGVGGEDESHALDAWRLFVEHARDCVPAAWRPSGRGYAFPIYAHAQKATLPRRGDGRSRLLPLRRERDHIIVLEYKAAARS